MSRRRKRRNKRKSNSNDEVTARPSGRGNAGASTKPKTAMQQAFDKARKKKKAKANNAGASTRSGQVKTGHKKKQKRGDKGDKEGKVIVTRTKRPPKRPSLKPKPAHNIKSGESVEATPVLRPGDNVAMNHDVFKATQASRLLRPCGQVIWETGNDEIELIIGLDFGTSYTKVVVQEPASGAGWAIPFTEHSDNPYLLPSRVLKKDNDYFLEGEGEAFWDLKVPLLMAESPQRHAIKVVAFLALVIRHVCIWVYENKRADLRDMTPLWSINLGLPAENLEDTKLVAVFRELLLAASLLAMSPTRPITNSEAEEALATAHRGSTHTYDAPVHPDQLGVLPEIAAQIYGYVSSDMWDRRRPEFMLVDVGGGTVDASIFNVVLDGGDHRFVFFKSSVFRMGSTVLHKERLEWLAKSLEQTGKNEVIAELRELLDRFYSLPAIPGRIEEYLTGADFPSPTMDAVFGSQYERRLWDDINFVRKNISTEKEQWKRFPFVLCGGGRYIELYRAIIDHLNANQNFHVGLQEIDLTKPDKLDAPGLRASEYHRISVAYGLSFQDLGEILTPDQVKDLYLKKRRSDGPTKQSSEWRFDR